MLAIAQTNQSFNPRRKIAPLKVREVAFPYVFHKLGRSGKYFHGLIDIRDVAPGLNKKQYPVADFFSPIKNAPGIICLDFDILGDDFETFEELEHDLIDSVDSSYITTCPSPSGKLKAFVKVRDDYKLKLDTETAWNILEEYLPARFLRILDKAGMRQCFITPKVYNAVVELLKHKEELCDLFDHQPEREEQELPEFGSAFQASILNLLEQSDLLKETCMRSLPLSKIAKYLAFHYTRLTRGTARFHNEQTAQILGCSQGSASKALKLLRDAGILKIVQKYRVGVRATTYGFTTKAKGELSKARGKKASINDISRMQKIDVMSKPFSYGNVNSEVMEKVRCGIWLGWNDAEIIQVCLGLDRADLHISGKKLTDRTIKAIIKNWKRKKREEST